MKTTFLYLSFMNYNKSQDLQIFFQVTESSTPLSKWISQFAGMMSPVEYILTNKLIAVINHGVIS